MFIFAVSPLASGQKTGLQNYLPRDGEIKGWKINDLPQEYKGEDLYLYIDGGAEIYREYGFSQVIVQDFTNPDGKSVSLEIFEMVSPESAYGMYTFKTSPQGEALAIGGEARLEGYYLNFWKGNYLVTLTGFAEDKETVEGLLEIGRSVDVKLPKNSSMPGLVKLLPEKELIKPSVKYFIGHLGLFNIYASFPKEVFGFKEGIKADYHDGLSLFALRYPDSGISQSRFGALGKSFGENPKFSGIKTIGDGRFEVGDDKGNRLVLSTYGRYLTIVMGRPPIDKALNLLEDLQTKIKKSI
jgi:hypothetical protein